MAKHVRIGVSGIDGGGKSTLCRALQTALEAGGASTRIVGNLPRAYRQNNNGVVDADDPFLSSFFFNYAAEHHGDPGSARFAFDARYVNYVMALEEVRLDHAAASAVGPGTVLLHDRHLLDRRVNAYRAGCPRADIDVILSHAPAPDLTVVLDLPAELAVERVALRGRPGRDENVADLAEYRELYLSCAQAKPNVMVVDAARSREEVFDVVISQVEAVLAKAGATSGSLR
ncbi:dTMP kinase [Kitasatospora sp. NPDC001574]